MRHQDLMSTQCYNRATMLAGLPVRRYAPSGPSVSRDTVEAEPVARPQWDSRGPIPGFVLGSLC